MSDGVSKREFRLEIGGIPHVIQAMGFTGSEDPALRWLVSCMQQLNIRFLSNLGYIEERA